MVASHVIKAKKNELANALKVLKRRLKEFGFTGGMMKAEKSHDRRVY